LLVVHNFDTEAAANYAFSLEESTFRSVSSIDVLFATSEVSPTLPSFSEAGALVDYKPIESLAPQSMYVLRLNP
jgi:hypothetical protein